LNAAVEVGHLSLKLALDVDERGLKAQEADFMRIDENNATQWKMRARRATRS